MHLISTIASLCALVNRISGPNNTEIAYGSAAGGFQVFISGAWRLVKRMSWATCPEIVVRR